MNTKHTPGPAIIGSDGKVRSIRAVRCAMMKLLKTFSWVHGDGAANSKAIIHRQNKRMKNAPARYARKCALLSEEYALEPFTSIRL